MILTAYELDEVYTFKAHPLMTRFQDKKGNEYIFLPGVSGVTAGQAVTFTQAATPVVALIAANAVGFVGVAQAAINTTSKYGWYLVKGRGSVLCAAAVAADKALYIAASNVVDDGSASGDKINGMWSRSAQSGSPAALTAELNYPYVDDASSAGA